MPDQFDDNDYGDQDFEDDEQKEPITKGEDVPTVASPAAPSAAATEQAESVVASQTSPPADNAVVAPTTPLTDSAVAASAPSDVEASPVASNKVPSAPLADSAVVASAPSDIEASPVASNKATGNEQKGPFPPVASPSKAKEPPASPVASPTKAKESKTPSTRNFSNSVGKEKMSKSLPELGSFNDLRQKTEFSMTTTSGVLQGPTFQHSTSNFRAGPKYSMGARGPTTFVRGTNIPAAGTYNMPASDKTKYQRSPQFSWGCSSRFGMGVSASKLEPGPGAYNPSDPTLLMETKIGFGTELRGKETMLPQAKPGPGAYEYRSCMGKGLMFTARGRFQAGTARARSQPGPGAYNPSHSTVKLAAPKCGFGTSIRDDPIAQAKGSLAPGPGTYELQQHRNVGSEAPKYSATSRRRVHDLNSYVTPGPGSYNSHTTSFG